MHVLGHDYIADYSKLIAAPSLLQGVFEGSLCANCVQEWLTTVATEGNEVKLLRLLQPDETPRHGFSLRVIETENL